MREEEEFERGAREGGGTASTSAASPLLNSKLESKGKKKQWALLAEL